MAIKVQNCNECIHNKVCSKRIYITEKLGERYDELEKMIEGITINTNAVFDCNDYVYDPYPPIKKAN